MTRTGLFSFQADTFHLFSFINYKSISLALSKLTTSMVEIVSTLGYAYGFDSKAKSCGI